MSQLRLPGTGISGQDIYEAYLQIATWPEDVRLNYEAMGITQHLHTWQQLPASRKSEYNQVAELLNKKLYSDKGDPERNE